MLLVGILLIIILISLSINESKKNRLYKPIYLHFNEENIISSEYTLSEKENSIIIENVGFLTENESGLENKKIISKTQLLDFITRKNYNLESMKYMVLILIYSLCLIVVSIPDLINLQINNINNVYVFNGLIRLNEYTQIFEGILCIFGVLILYSFNSLKFENTIFESESVSENQYLIKPTDSFGLIGLFSLLGGLLLIDSNNLILLFISIELQSYSLYILASIYKNSNTSTDSGLKYFLLGGLASIFILFGSGLLYLSTGSIYLDSIYFLINLGYYDNLIIGGCICLILGLLLKAASAPMHSWSPDVYYGVPTLITTWLSVLTKISIIGFLSKLIKDLNIYTNSYNRYNFEDILANLDTALNLNSIIYVFLICAGLSMIIGAISGLKEQNLKRLFAFSGVTNIGYLLLALTNSESYKSLVFYLVQYSISNLNLFLIIILLGYGIASPNYYYSFYNWKLGFDKYSPVKYISQLTGMFYTYPYLAISFAITLFSLIGIPPLAGFYGKYFILVDSINSQSYFIVFILILASVISSFYYLRLIKIVFTNELSNDELQNNEKNPYKDVLSSVPDFVEDIELYSENELLVDFYYYDNNEEEDSENAYLDYFNEDFYTQNIKNNVSSELKNTVGLDLINDFNNNSPNIISPSAKLYSFDPICLVIAINTSLLISFFLFSGPILEVLTF